MKKICTVIGSRANYSSIKSALVSINENPDLELQIVLGASAILERYGSVDKLIEQDGFTIDAKVNMLIEGETLATMAKSTGLGLLELPSVFERLKPDVVITVGDRFETMATTIAAAYMNITVAHTMGGEVTGTIDESIRHAVTKFAHIHFPASLEARNRIIKLGEKEENVYLAGCPRIDLVKEILEDNNKSVLENIFDTGVGTPFDLKNPFLIVSQHPVTTEFGKAKEQILNTLEAVEKTEIPSIVLWPNADAGSDDIAKSIRSWREKGKGRRMYFFKNLPIQTYIHLMKTTSCLVGNSSSGIREGAFIGTPVVNIGTRQSGRERGTNVLDVTSESDEIFQAIQKQLTHGRHKQNTLYGNGESGKKIAEVLANIDTLNVQKRITY